LLGEGFDGNLSRLRSQHRTEQHSSRTRIAQQRQLSIRCVLTMDVQIEQMETGVGRPSL
jgi:hypothetical protein